MQRFTIFTIILSTFILAIIAELVVQDYLQAVYSPASEFMQANTLSTKTKLDEFIAPYQKQEELDNLADLTNKIQSLIDSQSDESNSSSSSSSSSSFGTSSTSEDAPIPSSTTHKPLQKIVEMSPTLKIKSLEVKEEPYNGKLFQLIDTSNFDLKDKGFANLIVNNTNVGAVYELQARTSSDAETIFNEIRLLANSFPNIDTNQTNQFGTRSFYINHLVKVGEVFVVIYKGNSIYAFSYKKEYHEVFKTFFNIFF